MSKYVVSRDEEKKILSKLDGRQDAESARIKRYLAMPDLSRTEGSPLKEIVDRVTSLPNLKNFDHIDIPEVISTDIIFDLFGFSADHPARSKSDTYYVDEKNVLRTHDTVMWYYYFNLPEIKEKIARGENLGVFCYGKVYRKDEIDRKHMNVFHQMGALYLVPDNREKVPFDELKKVLVDIVQSVFGKDTKYRFAPETFPYTDPSIEVEVKIGGDHRQGRGPAESGGWFEILGSGMPKKEVLSNFGLTGYNGWAFGFGLERLAIIGMELPDIRLLWSEDPRVIKQMKLGNKYVEVSKYPPIVRDISFVVSNTFIPNDYFDVVRELAPGLVEQVELIDKYENEDKFGKDKVSYAYRVTYRSIDRTLLASEIDTLHKKLEEVTIKVFAATVR